MRDSASHWHAEKPSGPRMKTVLLGVAVEETMARLDGINVSTPSLAMVSGATGNRIGVEEVLDFDRWRTRAGVGPASGVSARALADLAVDTLIEIGPGSEFAPRLTEAWPEMSANEGAAGPAPVRQSLTFFRRSRSERSRPIPSSREDGL